MAPGNALSRALKGGSSEGSEEQISEEESVESKAERVRGGSSQPEGATDTDGDGQPDASMPEEPEGATDTDGDGQNDASMPPEDSGGGGGSGGSGSGGGPVDTVRDVVDSARDRVEDALSGSDSSGSEGADSVRTAYASSEGVNDPQSEDELQEDVIEDSFNPETDQQRADDLERQVEGQGLPGSDNVRQEIRRENRFQDEDFVRRKTEFVRSVRAENQAERARNRIEENIDRISRLDEGAEVTFGSGEDSETLSRDEALSRLRSSRDQASQLVESADVFQEDLQESPESQVISMQSLPESVQRDLRSGSEEQGIDSLPTDSLNTQYPGGTRILGGRSLGDPLSRPGFRRQFNQDVELAKDISVLAGTEAGFKALPAGVDPERTVAGVIESEEREAEAQSIGQRAVEFLGSPGGLAAGAGIGRAAGAAYQGGSAIARNRLPSLASSSVAQTAGRAGRAAVVGGSSLFVGSEAAKGARSVAEGDLTEGGARILQVGTEAGAIAQGFRSASRRYSPELGDATRVEQDNILRQVADEDTLRGFGSLKARTSVTRQQVFGGEEKIGEAVSTGDYVVETGESFGRAQGSVVDEGPRGGSTERRFESLSRTVDEGDDEVLQRNLMRTQREDLPWRTSDFSSTGVVRREGSSSVNDAVSISTVEDPRNVVSSLEDDVVQAVRNQNIDAEVVRFQGYSQLDSGGEVFSDTESLVYGRQSGSGGGGAAGSSQGQGLDYGQGSGQLSRSQVVELQRQRAAAEQFGQASRESFEGSFSESGFVTGTTSGGQQVEGSEAGLGEYVASGQETVQREKTQSEGNDVDVIDIDTRVARMEAAQDIQSKWPDKQVQVERSRPESEQVASTASEIVDGLNEDFRSSVDTGVGQSQGVQQGSVQSAFQEAGQGQEVGSAQNQRSGFRARGPGFEVGAVSGQRLGVRAFQVPLTAVAQAQSLDVTGVQGFGQVSVPSGGGGGAAGVPELGFEFRGSRSAGRAIGSRSGTRLDDLSSVDWFSANLVEQKTGEEAVFPDSGVSGNSLFGRRTVQERQGVVEADEILDTGSSGGDEIW